MRKGPTNEKCYRCKRRVWLNHRRKKSPRPTVFACGECRGLADAEALIVLEAGLKQP